MGRDKSGKGRREQRGVFWQSLTTSAQMLTMANRCRLTISGYQQLRSRGAGHQGRQLSALAMQKGNRNL